MHFRTRILPFWTIAFLTLAIASLLRAQTIVYQVLPGSGSKNNAGVLIGESFATGSTATSIKSLDIYVNASALSAGNFTLSLYSVTGSPGSYTPTGSALFSNTYSNTILGATAGTHYLFDNLSWSVAGSTSYLVAFESSPSATVKWQSALSTDTANLLVGTSDQNRYASTTGVILGSFHAMTVTTSAIPEPSTYAAFAGLVVLGLAAYRRHRFT